MESNYLYMKLPDNTISKDSKIEYIINRTQNVDQQKIQEVKEEIGLLKNNNN